MIQFLFIRLKMNSFLTISGLWSTLYASIVILTDRNIQHSFTCWKKVQRTRLLTCWLSRLPASRSALCWTKQVRISHSLNFRVHWDKIVCISFLTFCWWHFCLVRWDFSNVAWLDKKHWETLMRILALRLGLIWILCPNLSAGICPRWLTSNKNDRLPVLF